MTVSSMENNTSQSSSGSPITSSIESIGEHVVIAGAGLVGSLAAIMMARRGYDVTVIEKRSGMIFYRLTTNYRHESPAGTM